MRYKVQNFLKEYSPNPKLVSFIGPNVELVDKSEKASDAYLKWFVQEVGTVPQMVHNIFSHGWDCHRAMMVHMFDEGAAEEANKSCWRIAHWGVLYNTSKNKKIPLPITDDPSTDYFRPAYGDTISVSDALTNGITQMYIANQCIADAYYYSPARDTRPPTHTENQASAIAYLLKAAALGVLDAGHKPLADFFRIID